MKTILFLTVLTMLASCSKQSGSKGKISNPTIDEQTKPGQPDIHPIDGNPDQTQDQTQDQQQHNGGSTLTSRYEGTNIVLLPGAESSGTISLSGKDADFLYRKLRIRAQKPMKSAEQYKIGKHVRCTKNSDCTLKINYQNAEVLEQDNQGDIQKTIVLKSRSYTGENLIVEGKARKAIITLSDADAKKLYQLINLGAEDALDEDNTMLKVKAGRGEAPLKCQMHKAPKAEDDTYSCSVTLSSVTGAVEVEQVNSEEN